MGRTSPKLNFGTVEYFQKAKTICNSCKYQDSFGCCTDGATITIFNALRKSYPYTWEHRGRTRPYPPSCKDKNPDGNCKQFTPI